MLGMRRGVPIRFMLLHAAFAQDLRADAVGAQVHAAALGRLRRRAPCLRTAPAAASPLSPQLSSTATPLPCAGDVRQAGVQAPGVHRRGRPPARRAPTAARAPAPARCRRRSSCPRTSARCTPWLGLSRKAWAVNSPKAVCSGARADLLDQRFVAAAVLDQVGDGADLQAVLGGEQLQVGQARHGAVVVHDLADHRGGRAAGHGGQVAAGFGMAGAHQHAAVDRLQREDVAGLHQVARRWRRGPRRPAPCARGRRRRCRWSRLRPLRWTR